MAYFRCYQPVQDCCAVRSKTQSEHSISCSSLQNWASWDPYTAACVSRLGKVILFIGATRPLPITNLTEMDRYEYSIRMCETADRAYSEASVKVWSSIELIVLSRKIFLGISTSLNAGSSSLKLLKSWCYRGKGAFPILDHGSRRLVKFFLDELLEALWTQRDQTKTPPTWVTLFELRCL